MSMTENEAIKIMDGSTRETHLYMYDAEDRPYLIARAENIALNALKEIQAYREIGTVEDLKTMKENGAFTGVELASLACMQLKLKDYQSIGTVEEFKELKEDKKFLEFLYNHILPNEMEQYLSMYHTKDKVAVNGYADQSGLMSAT